MPVANASNEYTLIGGTIRKTDGVWEVVDNDTHWSRGLGPSSSTTAGIAAFESPDGAWGLRVPLRPVRAKCGWGSVTVDGVLNACGITIGISANGGELNLTAAKFGVRVPFSDYVFSLPGANIWINWNQIL